VTVYPTVCTVGYNSCPAPSIAQLCSPPQSSPALHLHPLPQTHDGGLWCDCIPHGVHRRIYHLHSCLHRAALLSSPIVTCVTPPPVRARGLSHQSTARSRPSSLTVSLSLLLCLHCVKVFRVTIVRVVEAFRVMTPPHESFHPVHHLDTVMPLFIHQSINAFVVSLTVSRTVSPSLTSHSPLRWT
jgi:hypothetical protein